VYAQHGRERVNIISLHTSFLVTGINDLRAAFWASITASALRAFYRNQALSAALSAVASGPWDLCVMECPEGCPHPVAACLAAQQEGPTARLAADEGEPQERDDLWFAEPTPFAPGRRVAAEFQQAGLLPMKLEPELLEPHSHRIPEAPRVGLVVA
jgi:hypothetical protein